VIPFEKTYKMLSSGAAQHGLESSVMCLNLFSFKAQYKTDLYAVPIFLSNLQLTKSTRAQHT